MAADMRVNDKTLKTQIRYGKRDVELWAKRRGSDERYYLIPMEEIEKDNRLPKFDHTARWNRKQERPPQRKVSPTRRRPDIPSMTDDGIRRNGGRNKDSISESSGSLPTRKVRRTYHETSESSGSSGSGLDGDMDIDRAEHGAVEIVSEVFVEEEVEEHI